ncbi:hypothetical protein COLO4_02915 [Corchorus olitorius]|uniref:Fibronectin type III-like domain-containing protein n=1 Tax=Corchorus olitorius TaxID=93759 RepID=A0A1R3KZZ5_9ROSI|nr:hypothetical protein COLO4_02915 [Corchorus olitorius]
MAYKTFLALLLLSYFLSVVSSARHNPSVSTHLISNEDGGPGKNGSIPKNGHVCDPARFKSLGLNMADFAYCDKSLPYEIRVKDLVDRLNLFEKAAQMGDNTSIGVPRIGLPRFSWWSEALHGVSDVGRSTKFEPTIPSATSFPMAVSNEARAMYNEGQAGLTFWSPNINVVRDPRWGRTLETAGEDPFLVGLYAVNYVRGLQDLEGEESNSKDPNARPLKVSACCKHFTAYDVENSLGVSRLEFDAKVHERDMVETFNKPFEMCVKDGDVSSVMCSYNRVNGIPTCADPYLLKKTVRQDWDFHGQHWLDDTVEDASAQVLKAGLDLDCGFSYESLINATMNGLVRESDMDTSLKYLYTVLMRLGFFDGIPSLESLDKKDVCTKENIELATEAAREGIVLLKNEKQTLPLDSSKIKTLALIGPHANATDVMIGNYAGVPCDLVSPLKGFSKFGKVIHEKGCEFVNCTDTKLVSSAANAAKKADATILFMGINLDIEAEWVDRTDILLPNYQTHLVNAVADAANGPVILVIMSAGPIDISFAKINPKIGSIIWAGYPGEQGGRAIADVVFGNYNPGGRLTVTWYEGDYVEKLPMTSMPLRPTINEASKESYPGRTYKFFDGATVYPFGYGLSYTTFEYNHKATTTSLDIKLNKLQHCRALPYKAGSNVDDVHCPSILVDDLTCKDEIAFEITVQNVGEMDGSEVVLVYSVPPKEIDETHFKQLVAFERVFVPAKESKNVKFVLNACKALGIVDVNGYTLLPAGLHKIVVGDNAISIPIKVNYKHE